MATAPIGPLAWEPPYAAGAALKSKNNNSNNSNAPLPLSVMQQVTELQGDCLWGLGLALAQPLWFTCWAQMGLWVGTMSGIEVALGDLAMRFALTLGWGVGPQPGSGWGT